jgi:uncharacterized membrane protein
LIFIGLLIGIVGYVLLYLGKGIQKYAIEGLKAKKVAKGKNYRTWIFGTFLTSIYFAIEWVALLFAPIHLIAPLGGVGLLVMLPFAYYILHEEIYNVQIVGIGLIIIGIFIVTFFNPNVRTLTRENFNISLFLIFSLSLIIIEMTAIIISRFKHYYGGGLIIGITAGTFNALQTVSKRITAIPDLFIIIMFTVVTFLMAILTLIFTQFAFTKAKANIVMSCDISAHISFAVLIGFVALHEKIEIVQFIGMGIIIIGIIMVTAYRKRIKRAKYRKKVKNPL